MLMRFSKASNLIGCGGDTYQIKNWQGMHGGCMCNARMGVHAQCTWGVHAQCASLFVFGYHWLPLATNNLVGDNREFEV